MAETTDTFFLFGSGFRISFDIQNLRLSLSFLFENAPYNFDKFCRVWAQFITLAAAKSSSSDEGERKKKKTEDVDLCRLEVHLGNEAGASEKLKRPQGAIFRLASSSLPWYVFGSTV